MIELIYKDEVYEIIGACMEVHNVLGSGFLENVYKDALQLEFTNRNVSYSREVSYVINYKNNILDHMYFADFVVFDKIILEIKSVKNLIDEHKSQILNYLKISNLKLGLLVNFGKNSLEYHRFIN